MRLPAALFSLVVVAAPATAQDTSRRLTADDYARSERLLSRHTEALVYSASVIPHWLADGRFWYQNRVREGTEFLLVDPRARTREQAFDHERLAAGLAAAGGGGLTARTLPIQDMTFEGEELVVELEELGRYTCALSSYRCQQTESPSRPTPSRLLVVSPDGHLEAFRRDHDLWVRSVATGEETRLTTDGREDFGYATDNAGWTTSDAAVVKWSPDSRKIATFQHDARGVGMMYLVNTQVGHPELQAWKYPLPEDSVIFRISRIVIDLDRPAGDRVVRFDDLDGKVVWQAVIKAIKELREGKARSIYELAQRHGVNRTSISRLIPLAFLAPDIVEAILDGRQPTELTVSRLKQIGDLPVSWQEQRKLLQLTP